MQRWEKALILTGAVLAAALAVLPWVDRQFPREIRMAPVPGTSAPESVEADLLAEDPGMFAAPEAGATEMSGDTDDAAEPLIPAEPGAPATPESVEPVDPGPIVPEELPPPTLPPPPPIEP